jgi:seryl-tRNA synthetase
MAEKTEQTFIDNLITIIWNAEDAESVTNEMVAHVLDYLNSGYKDLLTNNSAVETECSERKAADQALQNTIDALNLAIKQVSTDANSAKDVANSANSSINALLGDNATTAIDNFNEILNFLTGIKDDEILDELLNKLRDGINVNTEDIKAYATRLDTAEKSIKDIQTAVQIKSVDNIDNIFMDGLYYLTIDSSDDNVLIVRKQQRNHRLARLKDR